MHHSGTFWFSFTEIEASQEESRLGLNKGLNLSKFIMNSLYTYNSLFKLSHRHVHGTFMLNKPSSSYLSWSLTFLEQTVYLCIYCSILHFDFTWYSSWIREKNEMLIADRDWLYSSLLILIINNNIGKYWVFFKR